MHCAVSIFATEYAMPVDQLAREAEARGFESLWLPEHTHIPLSRRSPWPWGDGSHPLPQEYYDTYDPFVALSFAAAATRTLKLATGICLVVERDPIILAKEVATLDRLSGGRFLFGVGGGWNAEEMENHGTRFDGRFGLLRERIEAMKTIWTEREPAYRGEHVSFEPIASNPKPLSQPHPPIHVGGAAPWGLRRAARYGNGWMPIALTQPPHELVADVHAAEDEAGRPRGSIELTIYGSPTKIDRLAAMRDAGVHRALFLLPCAGADQVLPKLDRLSGLMEQLRRG